MAGSPLLAAMNKKAVNDFRKDLLQMLKIGYKLDEGYGKLNLDMSEQIKKFDSLIKSFNKKYKKVSLKMVKSMEKIELKLLLDEAAVKEVFNNAVSKISGLQSIGANSFGRAIISDPDAFSKELDKAKGKLCITFHDPESGTSNVLLKYDKKSRKVELVYELSEIEIDLSPEFQIAVFYALSEEYNKKIKLYEEASMMGFSLWSDHYEKIAYYRKFDPHISE